MLAFVHFWNQIRSPYVQEVTGGKRDQEFNIYFRGNEVSYQLAHQESQTRYNVE